MHVLFFSFWWYHLILCQFFRILLIFWLSTVLRCKDNFGYLGLMLVYFTMGGSLEHFLRTHYHSCYHTFTGVLYRQQSITIINSLLHWLLCALLHIFSEISTYLHDFQRVTTKDKYIKKTDVNAWKRLGKMTKCTYFTENVLDDISRKVLKIVTKKMVQYYHKSIVTCMVTCMITRGNLW